MSYIVATVLAGFSIPTQNIILSFTQGYALKVHGGSVKTDGSSNELIMVGKDVRKVITNQWCVQHIEIL